MLTHAGIREMEQALSNPDRPTDHFAAINILNIGTMSGGQVMQGSSNGTQNLAQSGKEEAKRRPSSLPPSEMPSPTPS